MKRSRVLALCSSRPSSHRIREECDHRSVAADRRDPEEAAAKNRAAGKIVADFLADPKSSKRCFHASLLQAEAEAGSGDGITGQNPTAGQEIEALIAHGNSDEWLGSLHLKTRAIDCARDAEKLSRGDCWRDWCGRDRASPGNGKARLFGRGLAVARLAPLRGRRPSPFAGANTPWPLSMRIPSRESISLFSVPAQGRRNNSRRSPGAQARL